MPSLLQFLIPPRVEVVERIDAHDVSDADFARSFADVARVNRFLGGTRAICIALVPMLRARTWDRPVRILDIATGSADIPRSLAPLARRGLFGKDVQLEIVATDNHPHALRLAQNLTPVTLFPEIRIESADALNLPYDDGAFDFALCSLAFHHFGEPQIGRALTEMERVTTAGFVVNDLLRDRIAHASIWALTRLVSAHPFTRHDAPASVLRAYTRIEYEAMLRKTGISGVVRTAPMYRALIVRDKTESQN